MDPATTNLVPRVSAEGQPLRVLGDFVTVRAVGADTGGAYALFETHTLAGTGVPMHLQRYEDEAFLVFEGTFAVRVGGQTCRLGPGGYLFVPRATPHAYTNVGPDTGRLLLLVSPGGIHEHFVAEIGALDAPDDERVATLAEKYGVEFYATPAGGRAAVPDAGVPSTR